MAWSDRSTHYIRVHACVMILCVCVCGVSGSSGRVRVAASQQAKSVIVPSSENVSCSPSCQREGRK